jgi:hypothetical protein
MPILCLLFSQSVIRLSGGWTNIHVCVKASLFSSYQVIWTRALLMGNGSHTCILGVGIVIMKFTSGMTVQLKNVQLKGSSLVLIIE